MSRPAFAKGFPSDPVLDRLVALFEQGNYAAVREEGRALLKSSKEPEIVAAIEQLIKRTEPDPVALYLLGLAAALLIALAGWYWTHPHPGEGAPPAVSPPAPGPVSS